MKVNKYPGIEELIMFDNAYDYDKSKKLMMDLMKVCDNTDTKERAEELREEFHDSIMHIIPGDDPVKYRIRYFLPGGEYVDVYRWAETAWRELCNYFIMQEERRRASIKY